uniref:Proteasome subunit alpha n=1 Tax=Panagrellus redivivus TaxID=6233 RepID=A0A7E4VDU4_PANRE
MAKAAKHAKLTFHPFAVSALVGGIDGKTPALFRIDTTIKTACSKAAAIGSGAAKAQAYLDEHYTDGLNKAGAVALAVKAILQTGTLAAEEAEIAVISVEKGFSTYSLTEKRNAIDDVV